MKTFFLLLLFTFTSAAAHAHPFDHLAEELARDRNLIDVSAWTGLELDIRYATPDNFTHQNVYGPFRACFLHSRAADMLKRSLASLARRQAGWKLRVFDCLRPVRAQAQLFSVVRGTPQENYVASPARGSIHNYGFALDVSLTDATGHEIDMGTPYDFFGPLAEPRHEAEMRKNGRLTELQLTQRLLLRAVMKDGGFKAIPNEWWHFNGIDSAEAKAKYRKIP